LAGLARRSTRIGTLRSRRSGAAFPVFAASAGGRRWGLVTRPRRELEAEVHEIVAVRPAEELEFGFRPSPEPIPPLAPPAARPGTTADGWRLRLPHQGLHSILSRLRPDDLARLAGGSLPADPAPTVVRSVARLTAQSKRRGSLRSRRTGQRMELFEAPGYSLLVRPAGEMQGEIVAIQPQAGGWEGETGGATKPTAPKNPLRVTITWNTACTFDKPCPATVKDGVYIVLDMAQPLKVGKTQQDTTKRMAGYRFCSNLFGKDPRKMYFVTGNVTGALSLDEVESLMMRLVNRLPRRSLRNTRDAKPRPVPSRGVEIRHTGVVPDLLKQPFARAGTASDVASNVQDPNKPSDWITTIFPGATFETPWG
jgi:hypothetical protein